MAEDALSSARRFSVPQVMTRVSFSAKAASGATIAKLSIAAQAAFFFPVNI